MTSLSHCPNCAAPLQGQYCSACGQNQKGTNRFIITLINEALEDIFQFNSRAWKTLFALLFRPGFLSNEYFKGRRASYVQPIRLYFITSILFFVMLSVINLFAEPRTIKISTNGSDEIKQTQVLDHEPISDDVGTDQVILDQADDKGDPPIDTDKAATPISGDVDFSEDDINLPIPFVSEQTEAKLQEMFRNQVIKARELAKSNPGMVSNALLELAPPVIFCLLPLFAVLLKLAFISKRFYYTEHLIFALHNHAFVFLMLTFYSLTELSLRFSQTIGTWLGGLILLWLPMYLWLGLKNVYQQGKFFTTVKFLLLGFCYVTLLSAGILFALLVGVMTL